MNEKKNENENVNCNVILSVGHDDQIIRPCFFLLLLLLRFKSPLTIVREPQVFANFNITLYSHKTKPSRRNSKGNETSRSGITNRNLVETPSCDVTKRNHFDISAVY